MKSWRSQGKSTASDGAVGFYSARTSEKIAGRISVHPYAHTLPYAQSLFALWFPKKYPWNNTSGEIVCSFPWDMWACWHRHCTPVRLKYWHGKVGTFPSKRNRHLIPCSLTSDCSSVPQSVFYNRLTWPDGFRGYPGKGMNTQKKPP